MNCPDCNADIFKIRVKQATRNWECLNCGCEFMRRLNGSYRVLSAGTVLPPPATPVNWATPGTKYNPVVAVEAAKTKEEFSRKEWDNVKATADAWPEHQKMMIYYYLNKSGLSMHGLDARIEAELAKRWKQ